MDGLVVLAVVIGLVAVDYAYFRVFPPPEMPADQTVQRLPSGIVRIRVRWSRRTRILVLIGTAALGVLLYFSETHTMGARQGSEFFVGFFLFVYLVAAARSAIADWGLRARERIAEEQQASADRDSTATPARSPSRDA